MWLCSLKTSSAQRWRDDAVRERKNALTWRQLVQQSLTERVYLAIRASKKISLLLGKGGGGMVPFPSFFLVSKAPPLD